MCVAMKLWGSVLLLFAAVCDGGVQEILNPSRVPSFNTNGLHALEIGLEGRNGRVGAFGDFDSDMYTDIIWISSDQNRVDVLLWNKELFTFQASTAFAQLPQSEEGAVINVAASDFNLDGKLDILVTSKRSTSTEMLLYLGNHKHLSRLPLRLPAGASGQPLVLEANGDLKPDLFGMAAVNGNAAQRSFWINMLPTQSSCVNGERDADEDSVDCGGPCPECACFVSELGVEGCGFTVVQPENMKGFAPISSAKVIGFADMDGDCLSDLVIPADDDTIEVWLNEGGDGISPHFIPPDPERHLITQRPGAGSVSLADFNRDGSTDMLYVVASDCGLFAGTFCRVNEVYIAFTTLDGPAQRPANALCTRYGPGYVGIKGFDTEGRSIRSGVRILASQDFGLASFPAPKFPLVEATSEEGDLKAGDLGVDPLFVRTGDFDLDGYVDLILILKDADRHTRMSVWLNKDSDSNVNKRTFEQLACVGEVTCSMSVLQQMRGVYAGAFFDINERGSMDVLAMQRHQDGTMQASVLLSNFDHGNMFLKVVGLNGVCQEWCSGPVKFPDPKPYGVNQHGTVWKYMMQDLNANLRTQEAVQLSYSSHMSLCTPYVMFGLGSSSYFIEVVYMGSPVSVEVRNGHFTTVERTIPNSQIFGSPTGPDSLEWTFHAYVHPSEGLLYVAVVLAVTLLVLALSIFVLQRREKYQDSMEKQLTAHAFI